MLLFASHQIVVAHLFGSLLDRCFQTSEAIRHSKLQIPVRTINTLTADVVTFHVMGFDIIAITATHKGGESIFFKEGAMERHGEVLPCTVITVKRCRQAVPVSVDYRNRSSIYAWQVQAKYWLCPPK